MPFQRTKPKLTADTETIEKLSVLANSRVEPHSRVQRATILLYYIDGVSVANIATKLNSTRITVYRCVDKALQFGIMAALNDLPRKGRPAVITDSAKTWLLNIACTKPKELGYSYELWTYTLLAEHIRKHCIAAGHECLLKLSKGTISKLFAKNELKSFKIKYYLERRDPNFE